MLWCGGCFGDVLGLRFCENLHAFCINALVHGKVFQTPWVWDVGKGEQAKFQSLAD